MGHDRAGRRRICTRPERLARAARLAAGADPQRISFTDGRLWIANSAAETVTSLDPGSGARKRVRIGARPSAAVYGEGVLWTATVAEPPPLPSAGGAELRLSLPGDYLTLDPAVSHSTADQQLEAATCAGLLNYPDTNAGGRRLALELATAMPQVSRDGRTYTFRIRSGFRFSPPSNEPITAATLKRTLERAMSPKLGRAGPGVGEAGDIVGLAAYSAGEAPHVSGIVARGNTLTIRLVEPSGDLVNRLALGYFCPVPSTIPVGPIARTRIVPGSGPYYVSSVAHGRVLLLPNPGYVGERPQRWARITYTLDVPTSHAVALVDRGELDYLPLDFDNESLLGRHHALERRYGPGTSAARNGGQRYFVNVGAFLDYIVLNANRPLFRDVRMRQAVNYALDRLALAASFNDLPGDGIVPPIFDGFRAGVVYPVDGGDLAAARRLAGTNNRPRRAVLSYCIFFPWGDGGQRNVAPLVKSQLARIGIDVTVVEKNDCPTEYDSTTAGSDLLLVTNFGAIVRDPLQYLDMALANGRYGSALGSGPWSSPSFRRRLEQLRALRGAARTAAAVKLEHDLMRAAPFAVYGTFSGGQYLAPRIGCRTTTAMTSLFDLVALCPRRA